MWGFGKNFYIEEIRRAYGWERIYMAPQIERWLRARYELSPAWKMRRSVVEMGEALRGLASLPTLVTEEALTALLIRHFFRRSQRLTFHLDGLYIDLQSSRAVAQLMSGGDDQRNIDLVMSHSPLVTCYCSLSARMREEAQRGTIKRRPSLEKILIDMERIVVPKLTTITKIVGSLVGSCYGQPHPKFTEDMLESALKRMLTSPPGDMPPLLCQLAGDEYASLMPKDQEIVSAVEFLKKHTSDVQLDKLLFSRKRLFDPLRRTGRTALGQMQASVDPTKYAMITCEKCGWEFYFPREGRVTFCARCSYEFKIPYPKSSTQQPPPQKSDEVRPREKKDGWPPRKLSR